ncbi:hypothetical protein H0H87_012750, partial [Tephrocybe sp. NHM501043]
AQHKAVYLAKGDYSFGNDNRFVEQGLVVEQAAVEAEDVEQDLVVEQAAVEAEEVGYMMAVVK